MEHYNILKPSLERFGKCQWNIKVYKRNRVVASSIECFPQDKNIVVEETDSFLLCSVSKNRMAVSTDTDFCGGRKAGQECHGLSQLRWGGMLY